MVGGDANKNQDVVDYEKQLDDLGYNKKIAEENKRAGIEQSKYEFQYALDTINGKTTTMKVLSGISKYTGIFWPIGKLIQWRMRSNAKNKLMEIRSLYNARVEQHKNNIEREKNLEEAGLRIEQQQNDAKLSGGPVDEDLEYKAWQGGRGIDVIDHSEILAKSNDELEMTEFKLDVAKRATADLTQDLGNAVKEKAELLEEIQGYIDVNLEKGFSRDVILNVSNIKDGIKKLKDEVEETKKQIKDENKRLQEIPKEYEKLNKKIADLEKKLSDSKSAYEELKINNNQSDKFFSMGKKIRIDEVNLQGYKDRLKQLRSALGEYLQNREPLQAKLNDLNSKLEQAIKIDNNCAKNMIDYNKLLELTEKISKCNKNINDIQQSIKDVPRDVLDARMDKVALESLTDNIRCISVGGRLYLDKKDYESKGYKSEDEIKIDQSERDRLVATQKLIKALKTRPIFKFLNSDNLAEYLTYNESTGSFDLYEGSLKDRKAKELHSAKKAREYFSDDIRFDTKLIEEDPTRARRNMITNMFASAWTSTKNMVLDVVHNPGAYAKAAGMAIVGAIPIVGDIVKAKSKEDLQAEYKTHRDMIASAPNTLKSCFDAFAVVSMVRETSDAIKAAEIMAQVQALSESMSDLSMIMTLDNMKILERASMPFSPSEVAMYVSEIVDAAKTIATTTSDMTELRKQKQDQLAKGHARFARMMQEAFKTADIERTNAILDVSAGVAKEAAILSCGFAGSLIAMGTDLVKDVTKSIYTAVANGKKDKDLLFSKEVLGDIDIDKNVLTDDDVQQVFKQVTGINDFKSLADMIRVTDAIDMHRALMQERQNINIPGVLHALGLKTAGKEEATVDFLLQKTSGDKTNYRERIRNAIQSKELEQLSGFKRWWKTLVGSLKERFSGRRKGHIENSAEKQREKMIEKYGKDRALRIDNARLLYDGYKESIMNQIKAGKKIDEIKHIKVISKSEHFIQLLSMTGAVKKMEDPSIYTKDIKIKPEELNKILDSAISEVNNIIDTKIKEVGGDNQKEFTDKQANKQIKNEGPVLGF